MSDELVTLIEAHTRDLATEHGFDLPPDFGAGTRLFGEGGLLDSIALVSLVVVIEQAIEEKFGKAVSLADEKALSQRSSPYRTIGTLATYAAQELAAAK